MDFLLTIDRNVVYYRQVSNEEHNGKEGSFLKYVCEVCGWVYDEDAGFPEGGIAPGTAWEDVPEDFECPACMVGREHFGDE